VELSPIFFMQVEFQLFSLPLVIRFYEIKVQATHGKLLVKAISMEFGSCSGG